MESQELTPVQALKNLLIQGQRLMANDVFDWPYSQKALEEAVADGQVRILGLTLEKAGKEDEQVAERRGRKKAV